MHKGKRLRFIALDNGKDILYCIHQFCISSNTCYNIIAFYKQEYLTLPNGQGYRSKESTITILRDQARVLSINILSLGNYR
jgi:hypothetical protein